MKAPAALFLAAFAGAALAQAPVLPTCAQDCAGKFFGAEGGYAGCGNDFKCICSNEDFIGGVACCLADACSPADQTSAVVYAQKLCTGVGVSVPSAVSCTSTTTGAAASGTGVTTGTGAAATTTGAGAASATSTSTSRNFGPKQTPMAGIGALGGLVAAVAML